MYAIEANDLSKIYRSKSKKKVKALQSLDLAINPGSVVGFLGPNGAGKSTTIKLLTGQIRATSGHACISGLTVSQFQARSKVGYLPENPSFYGFMTAGEYLTFVANVFRMNTAEIKAAVMRSLEFFELTSAASRPIKDFSKGMVQRLGLAQAMIHDPDIYILDEPMSGLDPIGRALVKDFIKSLKALGKTVFFSTHITNDVEAVCDQVAILVNGRLRALEDVGNLLRCGTKGYLIEVSDKTGDIHELQISREQLPGKLEELRNNNVVIERVNPKVRGLEEFFLDIVSKENHEYKN